MALILDAGVFIGFERGDRRVAALIEAARRRKEPTRTSSGCVAQTWRGGGRRPALAWLLAGVEEVALDPGSSREVGELCGSVDQSDVIDAHLALLVGDSDVVVTSDPADLESLLRARQSRAVVIAC